MKLDKTSKLNIILPPVVFADATLEGEINRFLDIFVITNSFVRTLVAVVAALVFFYFFWGLADYIRKNDATIEQAKSRMMWGVLGIFVLVSMWGLIYFFQRSVFGSTDVQKPDIELRTDVVFPE